jgi:transcriptional regulator with XRE-family HTH domain
MHPVLPLPIPARRALHKLGQDIRDARRRRRIPMALMAERARISRTTLTKIEKGDESVALGIYAAVLHALGLVERLAGLADPAQDTIGRSIEERSLPTRVRLRRYKSWTKATSREGND